MKDTTRATWLARIEEWRRSGKTAEEFAKDQPFSGGTLIWRASQLRSHADAQSPRQRGSTKRLAKAAPRLALAEVIRSRRPSTQSAALTLEIGSARIAVNAGFDRGLLREVVRALQEGQS